MRPIRLSSPCAVASLPHASHKHCWRSRQWHPRGVSLLEVLIAIFAIAVGLLGLAALIPTGQYSALEATKADRSAACGRAALAEVKIRRMLEPTGLLYPNMTDPGVQYPLYPAGATYDQHSAASVADLGAFIIDPLFLMYNWGSVTPPNPRIDVFPYSLTDDVVNSFNLDLDLRLPRVTLAWQPGALPAMHQAVVERLFYGQDDLVFDIDRANRDRRPRQSFLWDNGGAVAPAPLLTDDADPPSGSPLLPVAKGDYSWFLTVSPALTEADSPTRRCFTISTVVFHSRDLTANMTVEPKLWTERWAHAIFESPTSVQLLVPPPPSIALEERDDYLQIKPNQWIMMMAMTPGAPGKPPQRIARWYRVVRIDDKDQELQGYKWRRAILAGPDWPGKYTLVAPEFPPNAGTSNAKSSGCAVLINGVVGVYSQTIEIDTNGL